LATSTAYPTLASTSLISPSFAGLTLWNGGTQLGNQANYVGTTTVMANGTTTPAFLYYFSFGNSSPLIIPRNSTLPVTLKGNVNAYTAGNVSDDSVHTFEVVTSTYPGLGTATSTVVALGQTSNNPATVVLSGAAGNPQTVLRNSLTFSSAQNGATTGRSKSASDQFATLTFTPNNSGQVTLNTLTITFSGSAVSSTNAAADAFATSTYLALGTPGNFTGTTFYPSSTLTSCTSAVCTVVWSFGSGINGYQIQNSPVTFTLVGNTSLSGINVAGGQNYVSLYATLASPSAVQYTDGTAGTTVSGIGLPASVITPLQLSGVQYSQGS